MFVGCKRGRGAGEIAAEAAQERHAGDMPQPEKQEGVAGETLSYTGNI